MKLFSFLIPCLLVSCATKEVVEPVSSWRKSPSAWLNGAEVHSNVESLKGLGAKGAAQLVYRAGTGNLDGPLHWQFVAEGEPSEHLSLLVEEVQIQTVKTKRNVKVVTHAKRQPFGYEEIKKSKRLSISLKKKEEPKEVKKPKWLATYTVPGDLQLFPKADGRVTLVAKISIETTKGTTTEWVNFALLPNANKAKSFHFRQTMIEYGGVPIE